MMRHIVILSFLLFRVAPTLADALPSAIIPPPPATTFPTEDRPALPGGSGEFRLVVHRQDRVGWIGGAERPDDLTLRDVVGTWTRCPPSEYRGHPGVPEQVNARRRSYWTLVAETACRQGVPVALLDAVVLAESLYQVRAVSRSGAQGLAQLMPDTARELGVADVFDPKANLEGGARYLKQMMDTFGSPLLAVAAYNAGPGTVRRAGGLPLNNETPAYVKKVMEYWRLALVADSQEGIGQSHLSDMPKAITIASMTGVASQ